VVWWLHVGVGAKHLPRSVSESHPDLANYVVMLLSSTSNDPTTGLWDDLAKSVLQQLGKQL
jgi:hypothetical protein